MKQKMLELEKKEDGKENGTMSSVCEVTGPEVAEHNVQGTRNPADEATSEANGIVDGDKGNTPTNNVEENSEVNGIGGKMKNVSFQEIQEIDSDEPLEVIRTKSVIEAAAAAESSNDGEDLDITSILEEVLESAYKTKLFKQVVTDQKRGKHDQEKYDEQLQREYREIIKENKQRIMKSKFEKMMKALEKEETKKAQRPDVADVVPMYDGPPLSSTELVQVENQQNPDQENTVALPVWKRQSKKGGAIFIPKPISDEEVKAMYRESLMMDELEAMVEEKKQEELKKRARKNPAVQTGPIKATPVTKKIEKRTYVHCLLHLMLNNRSSIPLLGLLGYSYCKFPNKEFLLAFRTICLSSKGRTKLMLPFLFSSTTYQRHENSDKSYQNQK